MKEEEARTATRYELDSTSHLKAFVCSLADITTVHQARTATNQKVKTKGRDSQKYQMGSSSHGNKDASDFYVLF